MNVSSTYIYFSGILMFILGFFCHWFGFPFLETFLIRKNIAMKDGNPSYEMWKKLPFPFKLKVYLFNVTNPEEVQKGGNPILREEGPYIYDEFRIRNILHIDEDNDTIEYNQTKIYYFNKNDSGRRSEDDMITIINLNLVSPALLVESMAPQAVPMVNDALPFLFPGAQSIFVTASVKNILFEGLKMACTAEEIETLCSVIGSQKPPTLRIAENGKDFLSAFFHYLNNTPVGPIVIDRGIKNITNKGQIISLRGEVATEVWGAQKCDSIRGTDFTIFSTLTAAPQNIYFYVEDICRSLRVVFQEMVDFKHLNGHRFEMNETFGETITETCFCKRNVLHDENLQKCLPKGLMDLSPCVQAPVILSQPHFYRADRSLLDYAIGLKPQDELHKTYTIIEPKTGTPLEGNVRVQMNIRVKRVDGIDIMENITAGIFPILWFENGAKVSDEIMDMLTSNFNKLKLLHCFKFFLIGGGLLIITVSLILHAYKEKLYCFVNNSQITSLKPKDNNSMFTIESPPPMYEQGRTYKNNIVLASDNRERPAWPLVT